MSGYASVREVRDVIAETLQTEGRDPKNYNVTGIFRDAFYDRGRRYGYGARDEQAWRDAVKRHQKARAEG